MNDKKFDNIIKGKIDHLSPIDSKNTWTNLEANLDYEQHIISDEQFDNAIKTQFDNHRPQSKSEHWKLLKEELNSVKERKNTVFLSKVLEIAAIFLIIFTFSQVPQIFQKPNNTTIKELYALGETSEINPKPTIPKTSYSPSITNVIQSPKTQNNPDIKNPLNSKKSFDITSASSSLLPEPQIAINSVKWDQKNTEIPSKNDTMDIKSLASSFSQLTITKEKNNLPTIAVTKGVQDAQYTEEQINALPINYLSEDPSNEVRNILKIHQIATQKSVLHRAQLTPVIPTYAHSHTENRNLALSLWTSKDVNLINTPFDKLYSLASYKKEALSNSYGLNISKKYANLEVQTGVGYLNKSYQPKKVVDAYGEFGDTYFEKSLNKINYDLATIPVNFKYHSFGGAGWSVYLMAGAAINIVLNSKYDITESLVHGKPAAGRSLADAAKLDNKPFIKGFLKGDSFRENYYATVGFGFGVEKNIYHNTSIYIQPSYFTHILSDDTGIGPNNDKIHTSAIQVGIKTLVN